MTPARSSGRLVRWAAILSLGCAASQLDVGAEHPANPAATSAPLPHVGAALEEGFEPTLPAATAPHAHEHGGMSSAPEAPAAPPEGPGRAATPSTAAEPDATIWTCPMHPQIREPEPGRCPICGMKLVPASEEPKQGTP